MSKAKQQKNKRKAAFSLIELLIAMGMIGLGLLGIASLASQNVRVQYYNKNTLISAQLAQEGLELVRNIRDNDWKSMSPISTPDSLDGLFKDNFIIDYTGFIEGSDSVIANTPFLTIDNDGFYRYGGSQETSFRRLITTSCADKISCRIKCYITWQGQGQSGNYEIEDYLYAWRATGN
ncbi:MAG TPA: prepilin-type N-terminal cleavage/methylation domain-containing protein [bacterium]|nr:prepilin-type N-terminal cleavage/methylation domain-containing protein [bacterium]